MSAFLQSDNRWQIWKFLNSLQESLKKIKTLLRSYLPKYKMKFIVCLVSSFLLSTGGAVYSPIVEFTEICEFADTLFVIKIH